jgi:hypothetical protein
LPPREPNRKCEESGQSVAQPRSEAEDRALAEAGQRDLVQRVGTQVGGRPPAHRARLRFVGDERGGSGNRAVQDHRGPPGGRAQHQTGEHGQAGRPEFGEQRVGVVAMHRAPAAAVANLDRKVHPRDRIGRRRAA